jgi:hypothetical protein
MSNTSEALTKAVNAMTDTENPSVFDVTIICTTDDHQADYWMQRLSEGICKSDDSSSPFPMVLAVSEDWAKGGAGNGLGTLYAYTKACKVAKSKFGVDLKSKLDAKEVSAALFHTAGKGTRLAPLPASENNNKPGVVSLDSISAYYTTYIHTYAIHVFIHTNTIICYSCIYVMCVCIPSYTSLTCVHALYFVLF